MGVVLCAAGYAVHITFEPLHVALAHKMGLCRAQVQPHQSIRVLLERTDCQDCRGAPTTGSILVLDRVVRCLGAPRSRKGAPGVPNAMGHATPLDPTLDTGHLPI